MNLSWERSPVFSAAHEIASSASTYAARPKQPHSAPAPSDGFGALIDSAAPASPDTRGAPQPAQPQRADSSARDADSSNTAKNDTTHTTSAPRDKRDASV